MIISKKRQQFDNNINYLSPEIQNEIIDIISKFVIEIIKPKKWNYFSIIVDDTADIAKHESVSICLRYVDDDLAIHEKFMGFIRTSTTTSAALCAILLKVMRSFGLDYESKLVGQCYDGAANMSGKKNGLSVQIRKLAKKAIYVHCYAHQLNLVIQHSCEETKLARNTL